MTSIDVWDDTGATSTEEDATVRVLLYSDDRTVRERVMLALGRRLGPGGPRIEWVEAATHDAVVSLAEAGGFDLFILDGEAKKSGGMGLSRQLKDEIYECPPSIVLTGRPQDAWLATWSLADAVVMHPLDPVEVYEAVVATLDRARQG